MRYAASRFSKAGLHFGHGTESSLDEAAALVLHALHLPYELPGSYFDARLIPDEREKILALIQRRVEERLPLAYLTHETYFAGLSFYVDQRVLVPRSPIAEWIDRHFSPWLESEKVHTVLDIGTGSGCIAIASAYAFPEASVDAVDISPSALEVARINVGRHGLEKRVQLIESDIYSNVPDRSYDLIISNPPYVSTEEWVNLPPEFHAEPRIGLEAGEGGLQCVRRIFEGAASYLARHGLLVVEVGCSAELLQTAYPHVPFFWLECERGGEGVCILTSEQVNHFFPHP